MADKQGCITDEPPCPLRRLDSPPMPKLLRPSSGSQSILSSPEPPAASPISLSPNDSLSGFRELLGAPQCS